MKTHFLKKNIYVYDNSYVICDMCVIYNTQHFVFDILYN